MPDYNNYEQLSDEQLFDLVRTGTTTAFDELYNRYSHRLFHYLLRMLNGDENRAQDLLQDVFMKILNKRNLFSESSQFSTWIFTIAHNQCKNEYRSLSTHKEVSLEEADYLADHSSEPSQVAEHIDQHIFHRHLLKIINSLSPVQRSVFLLRFQENLTIPEIARIMKCPAGTVKSRLHNILCLIAQHLKIFNPHKSEVL
jgi:RNA polymerase sigma-70 factor, ECF subfamily